MNTQFNVNLENGILERAAKHDFRDVVGRFGGFELAVQYCMQLFVYLQIEPENGNVVLESEVVDRLKTILLRCRQWSANPMEVIVSIFYDLYLNPAIPSYVVERSFKNLFAEINWDSDFAGKVFAAYYALTLPNENFKRRMEQIKKNSIANRVLFNSESLSAENKESFLIRYYLAN